MIQLPNSEPYKSNVYSFDEIIYPVIKIINDITGIKPQPSGKIKENDKPPFVTIYPVSYDVPTYGEKNYNDTEMEAEISVDVFSNTLQSTVNICANLRAYLLDAYTRQVLRSNGIVIASVGTVQSRSVQAVPVNDLHHHGFDLTIKYWRKYNSPVDTISSIDNDLKIKEEQ